MRALLLRLRAAFMKALLAPIRLFRRLRRRRQPPAGSRRVLVPFTRGYLEPTVLDAAIRIARAEEATLIPAYLILIPLQFALDAPTSQQESAMAIPLLEAVEHAAARAGVPVDARIESGRTPIHALEQLWNVEHFDRIVIPAPVGREPGFTPKELLWMLTNAPSETLILRPDPALRATERNDKPHAPLAKRERRIASAAERASPVPATQTH
jgi:nucleotide-binding universal stress UspA family protein